MSGDAPAGYRILSPEDLPAYLAGWPDMAERLGGAAPDWSVREIGDGNMNRVFVVAGPRTSLVVKQALPYIRAVGTDWPLTARRNQFEYAFMCRQAELVPGLVPSPYGHDGSLCLSVMAHFGAHRILREALVAGRPHDGLAEAMGTYLADMLFQTSDLGQAPLAKQREAGFFAGNAAMAETSQNVIFTGPYAGAALNRWTSPQLDDVAAALRADPDLLVASQELKYKFMAHAEALLHGDLHTGSIMVAEPGDVRVIDGEFAFYGPMGFDIGAYLGNLLLAYFAQPGHETEAGARAAMQAWLLDQVAATWRTFAGRFLDHWATARQAAAGAYTTSVLPQAGSSPATPRAGRRFMAACLADSLGFAGIKMIRRLIGITHVADFETIADPDRRAACERRALAMARELAVGRGDFQDIDGVCALARQLNAAA